VTGAAAKHALVDQGNTVVVIAQISSRLVASIPKLCSSS